MTVIDPQQAARGTPPSFCDQGLLGEAPALSDPDWLPQGTDIPELDDLREEHVRLLEIASEVGRDLAAVHRRHEQEDWEQTAALRAQATGQSVKLPKVTPPDQREAELAPLEAKARASREVREEFAQRAVATIQELYPELIDELNERDCHAEFEVEKARYALAEAEANVGKTTQLRRWLERTAGHSRFRDIPARHIQYGAVTVPPAPSTQPTIQTSVERSNP